MLSSKTYDVTVSIGLLNCKPIAKYAITIDVGITDTGEGNIRKAKITTTRDVISKLIDFSVKTAFNNAHSLHSLTKSSIHNILTNNLTIPLNIGEVFSVTQSSKACLRVIPFTLSK